MEDYKEKQRKYKEMYKQSGKMFWISKTNTVINGKVVNNPLNKGRTYVKKENEDRKEKNND